MSLVELKTMLRQNSAVVDVRTVGLRDVAGLIRFVTATLTLSNNPQLPVHFPRAGIRDKRLSQSFHPQ